jgi:hypothetical protein
MPDLGDRHRGDAFLEGLLSLLQQTGFSPRQSHAPQYRRKNQGGATPGKPEERSRRGDLRNQLTAKIHG